MHASRGSVIVFALVDALIVPAHPDTTYFRSLPRPGRRVPFHPTNPHVDHSAEESAARARSNEATRQSRNPG
ncbi:hypothetical protein PAXRUDRAFT_822911 [Paxillus rubicundulus Ve08.2h10]|uniref:Secreted protein n=1 Tax=Paxillus rubicundulus Ve08.2h10 TaxID=930991 RepID=A0A0D0DVZ9_9AGAM|nr:hypothetical protein PAXRUDRAFT_822911 [Paxillus rubicundulus Ve08.2h10]